MGPALLLVALAADYPQPPRVPAPPPPAPAQEAPQVVAPLPAHLSWALGVIGGAADWLPEVGLAGRLGWQFGQAIGVEGAVSGAWLFVDSSVRSALLFDWTPADFFTFAAGPLLRTDQLNGFVGCPASSGGSSCGHAPWVLVGGGTARLDFHLFSDRGPTARRAFTLGFALDLGTIVGSACAQCLANGVFLEVGYARY